MNEPDSLERLQPDEEARRREGRGQQDATFEASLAALEEAVRDLESGDLSLDEALARFAQGVALARACSRRLQEVEREMERLLREPLDEASPA